MEGFNREGSVEARGIIPRGWILFWMVKVLMCCSAIEQIFGHIQRHASPRMRFLVRASYLQIYNEAVIRAINKFNEKDIIVVVID